MNKKQKEKQHYYIIDLVFLMEYTGVYKLSDIRERFCRHYNINDAEYFSCLSGQPLEFFESKMVNIKFIRPYKPYFYVKEQKNVEFIPYNEQDFTMLKERV
jgi:hypothetical protein